jgi:uncharacterized coiled-coil DUF342 family protein
MKAEHKKLVAKAAEARKAIATERAKADKLQTQLDTVNEEIVKLSSELSEIEQDAADSGLAVSDLHTAVKG